MLTVKYFCINLSDKINELLELAWASTERDEEACSIFFDELSTCVRMLPKAVCAKFRDILKTKFEVRCVQLLFYQKLNNVYYLFFYLTI